MLSFIYIRNIICSRSKVAMGKLALSSFICPKGEGARNDNMKHRLLSTYWNLALQKTKPNFCAFYDTYARILSCEFIVKVINYSIIKNKKQNVGYCEL